MADIANCKKCGSFAIQQTNWDRDQFSVHCFNEFSREDFDCDAPASPWCPTSDESIQRWNEMQSALGERDE